MKTAVDMKDFMMISFLACWRKRDVYKSVDNNLEAYIAYFDGEPAGKCELFIQDGYAKIEDFDVVKKHQRKGIGTTMLRA